MDEDGLSGRLRWFGTSLKGAPDTQSGRERSFVMGGGSGRRTANGRHPDHGGWLHRATDWPPPEARLLGLHLRDDRRLRDGPPADGSSIA